MAFTSVDNKKTDLKVMILKLSSFHRNFLQGSKEQELKYEHFFGGGFQLKINGGILQMLKNI